MTSEGSHRTEWVERHPTDHRIVWITGTDASRFLHDLLSQNVAELAVGDSASTLLLAPNGKLRAMGIIANLGDAYAVLSGQADHVLADLRRFRIRVDVELQLDESPVTAVSGPGVAAAFQKAGWPLTSAAWRIDAKVGIGDPAFRDRWFIAGDLGPVTRLAAPLDDGTVEARRIELGEPRFGVDVDESTIPNEAFDLAAMVDFDKGCYLGQELVERIDSRGRQVKRLVNLVFAPGPVPPAGVELFAGDRQVGVASSTVLSPRLDRPIGLGMVRSEVVVGASVLARWDDREVSATVENRPLLTNS